MDHVRGAIVFPGFYRRYFHIYLTIRIDARDYSFELAKTEHGAEIRIPTNGGGCTDYRPKHSEQYAWLKSQISGIRGTAEMSWDTGIGWTIRGVNAYNAVCRKLAEAGAAENSSGMRDFL